MKMLPPPQNLNEINRLGTPLSHRGEGVSGAGVAAWSRRAVRVRPLPARRATLIPGGSRHDSFAEVRAGAPSSPLGRGGRRPGWVSPARRHVRTHPAAARHKEETCPPNSPQCWTRFLFPSKEGSCCVLPPGFPVSHPSWPPSQAESPSTFTRNQQPDVLPKSLFRPEAAVVEAVVRTGDVACPIP